MTSDPRDAEAESLHRAARIERERIAQSNHVSGIVQDSTEHWVVLHDRFAIADALYAAGYRLVGDLADLRALVEKHERAEAHNATVPLNRLSDLQQEPRASEYRAILNGILVDSYSDLPASTPWAPPARIIRDARERTIGDTQ